jgi:hypothetical protein
MLKNKIQNPDKRYYEKYILIIIFTTFLGLFGVTFGDGEFPPADCARSLSTIKN